MTFLRNCNEVLGFLLCLLLVGTLEGAPTVNPGLIDAGILHIENGSSLNLLNLEQDFANLIITEDSEVRLQNKSRLSLADSSHVTVFDGGEASLEASTIFAERSYLTVKNVKMKLTNSAKMYLRNAEAFIEDQLEIDRYSTLAIGMDEDLNANETSPNLQPNFAQIGGRVSIKNDSAVRMSSEASMFMNTSGGVSVIKKGLISLDAGARLELHDHSYLEVWDNSSLRLGKNANLLIVADAWLRVDYNSRIVIGDDTSCLVLHSYADYRMIDRKAVLPINVVHGFYCHEKIMDIGSWSFWNYQIQQACNASSSLSFCDSEFLRNRIDQQRKRRSALKWHYSPQEVMAYRMAATRHFISSILIAFWGLCWAMFIA